jgi:YD repeat-containing protein
VTATNLASSGAGASASATFATTTDASGNVTRTATDSLNRTTTFFKGANFGPMTIKRPGASSPNVTVNYGSTTGLVSSVVNEAVTYTYGYTDAGSTRTTTVTDPNGGSRVYIGDTTTNLLASFRNELNRLTSYVYDTSGRVTEITLPEGNKYKFTYDARGNVVERRLVAKVAGTPADIVTTASYPASCSSNVTCNKPTSTTDAKGNVTDYTYDTTHGGILSVTAPAATNGGVRPQTRYTYGATNGVSVVTGVSTCQTTASCIGTADEIKTTVTYDANLLPSSTSSGSGDGTLTATTAFTYDAIGNRTYVDGPLPGTGRRRRSNAARRAGKPTPHGPDSRRRSL